jgi:hypothetical protein
MMTVPLTVGFCPERWKQAVDIMLEKIPGVPRYNKLRIIQLLKAYLNQVLRISLERNISRLVREHSGIIVKLRPLPLAYGRTKESLLFE